MKIPNPKYVEGETFIVDGKKYLVLDYLMVTKKFQVSEQFSYYTIQDLQNDKVYQMPWSRIQNADSTYAGTIRYGK